MELIQLQRKRLDSRNSTEGAGSQELEGRWDGEEVGGGCHVHIELQAAEKF